MGKRADKAAERVARALVPTEVAPVGDRESPGNFTDPDAARASMERVIHACAERLATRWGISMQKLISCGSQGCTVETGDGKRIIKLTADPTEAKAADWIRSNQHTMLPKIDEVLDLSRCAPALANLPKAGKTWAIIREDLPFDADSLGLWQIGGALAEATARGRQACRRPNDYINDGKQRALEAVDVLVNRFAEKRDRKRLKSFARWSQQKCAAWGDLMPLNFRRRKNGELVLADFGVNKFYPAVKGEGVLLAGTEEKKAAKVAKALRQHAAGCFRPGSELDLDVGQRALDFLKRRTAEDPWFGGATLAYHSGQFNYTIHQQAAEDAIAAGPEAMLTEESAKAFTCGKKLFGGSPRARLLPVVAKLYVEHCGADGEKCKTPEGMEKYLLATRNKAIGGPFETLLVQKGEQLCADNPPASGDSRTGLGAKIRELVREYAGDPGAVALDRHTVRWLCEESKPGSEKARKACRAATKPGDGPGGSGSVDPGEDEFKGRFLTLKQAFQKQAVRCGLSAAHLQVSAWWKRTCRSNSYAWLGAEKKLGPCESGKMAFAKDMQAALAADGLASPNGTLMFCSAESKDKVRKKFEAARKKALKAAAKSNQTEIILDGIPSCAQPSREEIAALWAAEAVLDMAG